jgi:hypothetical protein
MIFVTIDMMIFKDFIVMIVVVVLFQYRIIKMHVTPQMIISAMQLYFTGESLRYVQFSWGFLAFWYSKT